MAEKQATVKSHVSADARDADRSASPAGAGQESSAGSAEAIRLSFSQAWGEMGAAWGVPPALARVHGYLLARRQPLTEREIREALGLSHRAASLALEESEAWGLIERVPEARRTGRRGPAGAAYAAVGDHWRWFGRVVAQRKIREGDPIVAFLAGSHAEAVRAAATRPEDAEIADLRDWLGSFLHFVRLFDRAVGLVPDLEPRQLERGLGLLESIPDETVLRLVRLLVAIPDEEVVPLLDAISRLSPTAARRLTGMVAQLVRAARR